MAIPNPYQQIAEYKAQPKPRKHWTVLDVMDYEDVIGRNDESLARRAKALFASLEKNPHTRFIDAAMATPSDGLPVDTPQGGLVRLVSTSDKRLTDRQQEATDYYTEAIAQNIPHKYRTGYIAKRMNIGLQSVRDLLKRANVLVLKKKDTLKDRGIAWSPTDEDLARMKRRLPRQCAAGWDGCDGDTRHCALALCPRCHKIAIDSYGDSKHFPDWLIGAIQYHNAKHLKDARRACYEDYVQMGSLEHLYQD